MINCFCGVWPWGDGCPVAKTNMPAVQVLKPGKNAVQLVSYQQLCWRGLVFETEVKNNETPIPKKYSIQTHKYQRQCQKIPHKKKQHFQVRSRKICSRVKYSKTAQYNYSVCLDSLKNPLKKSELDYATLSLCPDGLRDVLF